MQYKVAELEGELLDAAVAKAEGDDRWSFPSRYSSLWEMGGPIIDREVIALSPIFFPGENEIEAWEATPMRGDASERGQTALIAAMRAYVASKFGDTVELP